MTFEEMRTEGRRQATLVRSLPEVKLVAALRDSAGVWQLYTWLGTPIVGLTDEQNDLLGKLHHEHATPGVCGSWYSRTAGTAVFYAREALSVEVPVQPGTNAASITEHIARIVRSGDDAEQRSREKLGEVTRWSDTTYAEHAAVMREWLGRLTALFVQYGLNYFYLKEAQRSTCSLVLRVSYDSSFGRFEVATAPGVTWRLVPERQGHDDRFNLEPTPERLRDFTVLTEEALLALFEVRAVQTAATRHLWLEDAEKLAALFRKSVKGGGSP